MIAVSIIIVNYNTRQLLKNCIASIYKECTGNNFEIIVVDNNSADNSGDMVKEYFPDVKLIESKDNNGYGKGNNIGVKSAIGEYILILNADTIVMSNIVDEFLTFCLNSKEREKIGCLGAWMTDEHGNPVPSTNYFPTKIGIINDYLKLLFNIRSKAKHEVEGPQSENVKLPDVCEVDYIIGAVLFIRKDIYEELNGFDEDFFLYFEEIDMQRRMAKQGLKRILLRSPKVIHLEGQSPKVKNSYRIVYTESSYKYFEKDCNKTQFLLFKYLTLFLRLPTFFSRKFTFRENIEFYKKMIF